MNVKPVKVQVTPVKGNLQGVMEVGDGGVTADQEPSPDHRADAANPDMHLVGLDATRIFHNTASLPRNSNQSKQEVVASEDRMGSSRTIQQLPPVWNGLLEWVSHMLWSQEGHRPRLQLPSGCAS